MTRQAQKSLDRLPKRDAEAIMDKLSDLPQSLRPRGVEKLKSATELWRIRQGDYRIVYSINDELKTINIWDIGHRREIYRSL